MIEVLLFSLSISIDAFGYSLGFGAKNIKLTKLEFFILNLLNITILILIMNLFSIFSEFLKNPFLEKVTSYILILFGLYNISTSFITNFKKNNVTLKYNLFTMWDFITLLFVFIFENCLSSFVFYTTLSNEVLFVSSVFIFHYLFFIIGFDFGKKIVKKIKLNSSFICGLVFILLGYINLFF